MAHFCPRCLFSCGLAALLLLLFVGPVGSKGRNQRRMRRREAEMLEEPAAPARPLPPLPAQRIGLQDTSTLLNGCNRLFIDGGSNSGESVRNFLSGGFFTCGLHSPSRQYNSRWGDLTRSQRAAAMQPLREPSTFCVRSFEAAGDLMAGLREQEATLRARGSDVRFVHGALSNVSAADAPRNVARYAQHRWGSSAIGLAFGDVHVGGKPVPLSTHIERGPSYDLRALLSAAVARNASSVIALKLDVEGSEWWLLEALTRDVPLLCSLSYLFVEFHSTASAEQRAKLPSYGLREDLFEALKSRVHAAMEARTCRLQIYWRSFWASCGDKQRFEWRTSEQATAASFEPDLPRSG